MFMKLTVRKILDICKGSLICGNLDLEITHYSKDTRNIQVGDCYVGIQGETFNGNLFWRDAKEKGACACIVDSFSDTLDDEEDFTIIQVSDSIKALQDLATYVREQLDIPVVAITGSAGKTTTKDMIASLLSEKYKVLKTPGNLNGQIGLPFNILEWNGEEVMVLEMGMNDFGQMDILTRIAKPTIAVITNIGTAHIGILGSRENILKAKLEILHGMKEGSDLIINADNDLLKSLDLPNYKLHSCGMKNQVEYFAKDVHFSSNQSSYTLVFGSKETSITIPVMGEVFVLNSLLACCVGDLLGLTLDEIKRGLGNVCLSNHRMEIIKCKHEITLINDSYNANFEAVESALNILKAYDGRRKIAVLGDILEMEDWSEKIHRKIGSLSVLKDCDRIYLCGDSTKYIQDEAIKNGFLESHIFHFENTSLLKEQILQDLLEGDTILVKASKAMHFQELAEELKKDLQ